jgi:hypothetical protein
VQDDEPTVPHLPPYARSGPSEREPEEMPTWPAVERQSPRAVSKDVGRGVTARALATGLAVSLVANGALLVALVSVLLFARAGFFSPRSASLQPTLEPSATSAVGVTSAPASPTPSEASLQVAPSSVQLGCDGDQATQVVTLTNSGSVEVQWEAVISDSADQLGIEVDPMQGDLSEGESVTIQIHNTAQADAQQGEIRFDPDPSSAGVPPTLDFTTSSCS